MHPSDRIRYARGTYLGGKRIALAITGSIAAVESVKIARELIRYGADVYPYMTKSAEKFIGREALRFATGHEAIVELTGMDEHLYDFDSVLVAPATADIISKAVCGIADDAVSTLILANLKKCIFVPAMSTKMYSNPIVRENIEKLKLHAKIVEPVVEEEEIKVPSRERIAAEVMHHLGNMQDRKILVIGGAGYEKIDDFRIITNLSTGRTAVEIAKAAYFMGADVTLLMGLHSAQIPDFIPRKSFSSVESLIERIDKIVAEKYDAIIVPAALPDFAPSHSSGKISFEDLKEIRWREAPKFLEKLGKKYDGLLVGFKAEARVDDSSLISSARNRLNRYNLSMIVANHLEEVRENESRVLIITEDSIEEVSGKKEEIAMKIVGRIMNEI